MAEVVKSHEVLNVAAPNGPSSTWTSTVSMPEPTSDSVPLTSTVLSLVKVPSAGDVIATSGSSISRNIISVTVGEAPPALVA